MIDAYHRRRQERALNALPHFDIHRFTAMEHSGHFPTMESPNGLVCEMHALFRALRE